MEISGDEWVIELQKNIGSNLSPKPGVNFTTQYVIFDESEGNQEFFFQLGGKEVLVSQGRSDSPDATFSLDRSVAESIRLKELTTEEAFLKGLLLFEGDTRKLIDIFSEIV